MSVNTPASWSAHALRARLGMLSGPAALRGLTRLNVSLTSAAVKESPHVLVAGRVSGTLLSSNLCPYDMVPTALEGQRAHSNLQYTLVISAQLWQ